MSIPIICDMTFFLIRENTDEILLKYSIRGGGEKGEGERARGVGG